MASKIASRMASTTMSSRILCNSTLNLQYGRAMANALANNRPIRQMSTAEGKVALITGGASGMGLATAENLTKKGWKVSIADMNEAAGQQAAEKLGGMFTKTDVTKYETMANTFKRTWEKYGRLDFVFANAGVVDKFDWYAKHDEVDGMPPPPELFASKVMYDGALYAAYLGMHYLRKTGGGSLIVTASSAAVYPSPYAPLYTASKHGALGLVRSMAAKLADENIHVSCICPGTVATGLMTKEAFDMLDQETFTPLEEIVKTVDMLLERGEDTRGAAVEVVTDRKYLRWRPEYCDDRMEKCWISMGGSTPIRQGGVNRVS